MFLDEIIISVVQIFSSMCVCLFKHQVDFLFSFVLNDDDRYLSFKRKMKLKLVKQIR